MKNLNKNYIILKKILFSFLLVFLIIRPVFSNQITFEIKGNNFTDSDVILSILNDIPEEINEESTNDIIKTLNDLNLFSDVRVSFNNNKYIIIVKEFPIINKLYFANNKRLDDDELKLIASDINFENFTTSSVNTFIDETKKVYQSFGYNNVEITYKKEVDENSNTIDLYFDVNEGKITKINRINIVGSNSIIIQDIQKLIQSKTKSFMNIFANNNYKPNVVERDMYIISNYYKNNGFLDVNVRSQTEYLKSNKVNIYFYIQEGIQYNLTSLEIIDTNNILNLSILKTLQNEKDIFLENQSNFSLQNINDFKDKISSIILNNGIEFFDINSFEKKDDNTIDIIFEISQIKPKYTNQINIIGNSRTFDNVIRRELDIIEGDAVYETQINNIQNKLISLGLFEKVNIKKEFIDDNKINLIIEVEEKQTGSFNAGLSVGTIDGFAIVTGLRERNFYGTGRSLDFLVNTSEDKNQFKFITTDRLSYENDIDISYSVNYQQEDFSSASSYKVDTFSAGTGIGYKINRNTHHNIDLEYVIKDYKVTNLSTVSDSIASSSGSNMSYLIKNNIIFSSLNPGFISKEGNFFNFNNTIETPTSSSNGFIRNILTMKNYYNQGENIFSIQTRIGNIFSLNNNDILTDDKFSLGGRWLRGFDAYGAGPRNSRTSYVGGNNLIVTKLDYSYQLTKNSNFPIYFNFFNDYGLVWDNKTKPTKNDNSLRGSVGFGFRYYSPIGPIGFTWGFPIMDEEYDIKRMFLFSIGNID